MRPLTEQELQTVLEKFIFFIGKNVKALFEREDESHCFRLHKNRVFYVSERLMKRVTNVKREKLASLGVQVGRWTHSGKFRFGIGVLDILAQYAKYKVWVKSSAEMSFLYGNHILKSGLAKITENTPANAGVVIFSMSDLPLGFGVTSKSTADCRNADPTVIVTLHQADVGEYLRSEEDL